MSERENKAHLTAETVASHEADAEDRARVGSALNPSLKPRANRRRFLLIASTVSLALIAAWFATNRNGEEDQSSNPIVSVRVARAERRSIAAQVAALGTISPHEQAVVSARTSGQIKRMRLLKNAFVRKGDVIAVIDVRDLEAQRAEAAAALEEARLNLRNLSAGSIPQTDVQTERELRDARAELQNARALYERRRALYEQGGIALKDLEAAQLALTTAENRLRLAERTAELRARTINPTDRAAAQARVKQAEERLASLNTQISYATVRAPISGIITDQYQFQGEYVAPGSRLVAIADTSSVIVKAQFPDTVADELKVGDAATVQPMDSPGETLTGPVTLVSRSSDPNNRTVEVWITLNNAGGRLRVGSAARVTVTTRRADDTIVVPLSAITFTTGSFDEGIVMVVDQQQIAHEVKVTVGIRTSSLAEIRSGLQGGELVIVEGNYVLPDGTKVKIEEERS